MPLGSYTDVSGEIFIENGPRRSQIYQFSLFFVKRYGVFPFLGGRDRDKGPGTRDQDKDQDQGPETRDQGPGTRDQDQGPGTRDQDQGPGTMGRDLGGPGDFRMPGYKRLIWDRCVLPGYRAR